MLLLGVYIIYILYIFTSIYLYTIYIILSPSLIATTIFYKMNQINIITNDINNIGKQWVVYYILDGATAKVEFIGVCLLSQLYGITDAKSNPIFRQKFPIGYPAILQVTQFFQTKKEALPVYYHAMRQYNLAHIVAMGRMMGHAPVICNETGEEFNTIGEAATAHCIGAGNLSNHLNHKPGFRSIKGKTYSRKI